MNSLPMKSEKSHGSAFKIMTMIYNGKPRSGDNIMTIKTFRHSAGFGKRIEYWIIGQMLKEGLDVYVPLVDDDAIDAVIRRSDGSFITAQNDILPDAEHRGI